MVFYYSIYFRIILVFYQRDWRIFQSLKILTRIWSKELWRRGVLLNYRVKELGEVCFLSIKTTKHSILLHTGNTFKHLSLSNVSWEKLFIHLSSFPLFLGKSIIKCVTAHKKETENTHIQINIIYIYTRSLLCNITCLEIFRRHITA